MIRIFINPLAVFLITLLSSSINAQHPSIGGYNVYFGHLHNHTYYSDGTGSPAQAYSYARDTAGLDFFGLADHDYIENYAELTAPEYSDIIAQANANNSDGVFTTFYGFEWSDWTGHIAVVNADDFTTNQVTTTVNSLMSWISTRPGVVAFFNHPNKYGTHGQYSYNAAIPACKQMVGMELWNAHDGFWRHYYDIGYDSTDNKGDFDEALSNGWMLGACGSADDHSATWGTAQNFRMAILSDSLTRSHLLAAMKARRFYSTLEQDILLSFKINGQEMGSAILSGTYSLQIQGLDGGGENFTKVALYDKNHNCIKTWSPNSSSFNITDSLIVTGGDYYYVKVLQADSSSDAGEAITSPIFVSSMKVSGSQNITMCEGSDVYLQSNVTGGVGSMPYTYTYEWAPATGLNSTTAANPIASPASGTTYTVTVTDEFGNSLTNYALVNVSACDTTQQRLIYLNSAWKYNDTGTDFGTSWKDAGYDDTFWSNGNTMMGYGTIDAEPMVTTINYGSDVNNKYPTYYFRKTFNYSVTGNEAYYEINALVDDGAVFYINGVEVKRLTMPEGSIGYNTFATTYANETYQRFFIPKYCIHNGTNTIAVEVHQNSLTSSDLGFNMELIVHANPILRNEVWKYNDTGTDLGTSWKELSYDDAAWSSGHAQLGYGSINAEPITTLINYGGVDTNKYPTYYFRKTFDYTVTGDETFFEINALIDDGAVFYINGTEVMRCNMPAGTIAYNTFATTYADEVYQQFLIPASYIQNGSNTIAVEVHQNVQTSSDLGFNMELIPHSNPIESNDVWKYNDTGTDLGTNWKDVGYNDSLWPGGNALLGYGQIDAEPITTIISYGGVDTNKYPTYYFRKTFNYLFTGTETYFDVNALIDDGAVFYINGIEVKRYNMPDGTINYNTFATTSSSETYHQFAIPLSYIQNGSNTIAVEVHQNVQTSSDLGFNMNIIPQTDIPDISQIHFGTTDQPLNGATITWRSPGETDSIRWGYDTLYLSGKYAGIIRSNYFESLYDFAFPSLLNDTLIHYSIWNSFIQAWTPDKVYYTAKQQDAGHFTFTAFGDSRTNWDDWNAISNAVRPSDFVLFLGDMVDAGGTTSSWDTWFDHGTNFFENNMVYYIIGNHDINDDQGASNFLNLMVQPPTPGNELYYSFSVGNSVFIALNSEDPGNTDQYNWLINTLESNKDKKWRFVFFHRPFYTSPAHAGEMDAYFSTWWKAFDDYGVEVIFNGHTHNYQRTIPINRNISETSGVASYGHCPLSGRCQIVAGSAGAPQYGIGTGWFMANSASTLNYVNVMVAGDSLIIKTYDQNNVVIDSLMIFDTIQLDITASATEVCYGDSVTLTGSGAQSLSWDHGVINGVPFMPEQTETYTLIGSDNEQCAALSVQIIVNRFDSIQNQNICFGETFHWQGADYTTPGTYHADYLSSQGCDSTYTLILTVSTAVPDSVAVIGGGAVYGSTVLTASGGTGGTIYWQGTTADGTSTSTPSASQLVSAPGTYYFRAYNACGWGPQGSAVVTMKTNPIELNESWKYNDTGTDLGTSWKDAGYDDTSWLNGNALLGYGTIDAEPVVTMMNYGGVDTNKYPTYYFRKTFNYPVTGNEAFLEINALIDDGAVFYINGVEVKRVSMPAGTVSYSTYATYAINEVYQKFFIPASFIQNGNNTIAVEVHQCSGTSSDLGFNMNLIVHNNPILRNEVWKYNDAGTDLGTNWKESWYDDTSWASGKALLGYGSIDAEPVITTLNYGSDANNKYPTYYFRKTFDYTVTGDETYYEINALIDDGAVFYFNGNEAYTVNMPGWINNYNTLASSAGDEASYQKIFIPSYYIQDGTNTIAVEVHQSSVTSTDLGFNMDMIPRTDPITSICQIHFGTTDSPLNGLTVTWRNWNPTDSIRWGYDTSYMEGKSAGIIRNDYYGYLYDFTFPALLKDTVIHYSMWDSHYLAWTPDKVFYTAKGQDADHFTFSAFGDSQTNYDDWNTISEAVRPSDFVLFLGDVVDEGGKSWSWEQWFDKGTNFLEDNLVYYSLGNHELIGDPGATNFLNKMVLPPNPGNELYYSFSVGNSVFICLNSEDPGSTAQYNWLISTLESNKDKKWRFVFFHKPFYYSPSYPGDLDPYFSTWWKAFDDYGVEVIFNGHTHNYQRTIPLNRNVSDTSGVATYGHCPLNGRCQIIASGAGASREETGTDWFLANAASTLHYVNGTVAGDTLILRAYDQNNLMIDSFMIFNTFDLKISASATEACSGDPITVTGSGAQTYLWDHGVSNGVPFIPLQTDTYTLIGSNDVQCADTMAIQITVKPKYNFNQNQVICDGETYSWQGTDYSTPGTYQANYQSIQGCDSTYTLNLLVTPDNTITLTAGGTQANCINSAITTTTYATTGGTGATITGLPAGVTSAWASDVVTISGTPTVTGTFTYTITLTGGCGTTTAAGTITVNLIPTAEAGVNTTYTGTPLLIGDPANSPGTCSWLPATGLNNPNICQPLASPATTTTYTLTVSNNGCVRTDTVTIVFGGSGHVISGKTRYLKKATAGTPAPNQPTYSPAIYNIDNVEVILKSSPGGAVLATTISNGNGEYQFTGVQDGDYILAYDHIPYPDTMQYVNHTNAVDLALLKYHIGHNPLTDPSRNFSDKHRKAANVDNNASINTVDIARISAKIGSPNDPSKNFPKGNWVAFDTLVTVAGSDLNVTLQTVAYGDYDASSAKYLGAATNWGMVKELPDENIIVRSEESIMMSDPDYFEVPLRISTKMNELSAVGLELSYPSDKYKLVSASMSNTGKKDGAIKINPTLEEIIAANNDLLVTDIDGLIRVVFATTDHFDIAANEELVKLGFRSLIDPSRGELDFNLNGTGLIANQYGEINADAYLTMPKIFVQGEDMEAGFELVGYPNPFNGDATLTYLIPENGTVKLSVYNAIGELVSELVNETQISGKHEVVFSQKNLSAGMYTFKLEFSGLTESRNLLLKMINWLR
ncbi:MAG TPA: metallophosphoesterase [Bacteroidales bacterium]|nr:metallophosphoesterase [Bacteroidales bacterium]